MPEPVEIAIVFDNTGSMSSCINQVKKDVEGALTSLFKEMPNLKISIGYLNDYCDAPRLKVTDQTSLTTNLYELTQFVRNAKGGGGGDAEECYELVLSNLQDLNWSLNSRKIVVMIGDDVAHGSYYSLNKNHLDWRVECDKLKKLGVQIYAVQALSRRHAVSFWRELAERTSGFHLGLGQFSDVMSLILGVVYSQQSIERLDKFEEELVSSSRYSRSLDTSFSVLKGKTKYEPSMPVYDVPIHRSRSSSSRFKPIEPGLKPVSDGRFQIMTVDRDIAIKEFVEENDVKYTIGRGFYQFMKPEVIQENKEVILVDPVTKDVFSGTEARKILGIPLGERGKIKPKDLAYDVFIQSTSTNRKLIGGTKFLYEISET